MARRLLVMIAITTLLAACGTGGGGSNEGTAEGDTSTTEATGSSDADTLAEFFGYNEEDPEAAQARYQDEEAQRQELIRSCMAEQGFDYTPVSYPDSFVSYGPEDQEEYVKTQGFGITTWYGNEEQFQEEAEEFVDPNQEMVDAMSESEREAYYAALYGTEEEQMEGATTEIDPETGEEITYHEGYGAGCEGEASEEIYGNPGDTQDLWEDLQPQMDQMYERIQADPRVVEFNEEWSSCMAEAGYEVESREKMWETVYEDFQARFDEIVGPNGGYADPFEGWTEEEINAFFEEKTQDEIDAFFEQAQQDSQANIDMEALEALQQEEIDMAVADYECGAGYEEIYQEVSEEYESEFIAANRDALEEIREAEGR